MSATAQRYDIHDPDVVKKFAQTVQTMDRLRYLYLLTVADIRATNDNLWNGWRDSLLKQLYYSTEQWLEQHEELAKSTQEKSEQQRQFALNELQDRSWPEQQIIDIWQHYDDDYFLRQSVEDLVWQTEQRLQQPTKPTLVATRLYDQQDTIEILIITKDRPNVFAAISSVLEQLQLNILDAKINSAKNGELLNTFIVNESTHPRSDIINAIETQLQNLNEVEAYCPVHTPRKMKLFETEPMIRFESNLQQDHTILEVHTHDRPGLVSALAQTFLQCNVQLINAKLTTLGDQVEDVFFICTAEQQHLQEEQEKQLHDALVISLSH